MSCLCKQIRSMSRSVEAALRLAQTVASELSLACRIGIGFASALKLAGLSFLISLASAPLASAEQLASLGNAGARSEWIRAIGLLENDARTTRCTASLIAEDRILTAAHCLDLKDDGSLASPLKFRFGVFCGDAVCPSQSSVSVDGILSYGAIVRRGQIKLAEVSTLR